LHLVIGANEFLGRHVAQALREGDVPVMELAANSDDAILTDAIARSEVVVQCAQSWSPGVRLRYRKRVPRMLERAVSAAKGARVRRLVHVSTADVYGPDQTGRITEKAIPKPVYAYEKLRLFEEEWLLDEAGDELEVVIVRPTRVFGEGEDWILPRLLAGAMRGRVWLPSGGRSKQGFIAAEDVGRACLAASDRGRPGHRYLVNGFESSWRDLVVAAARAVGFAVDVGSIPRELFFLRAVVTETLTSVGRPVWPGILAIDALGRQRLYDDSHSRRELTWSPSVGSFDQDLPAMARWLSQIPEVAAAIAASPGDTEEMGATSPPGR
jgi:nucleoside-diphosphate-sugar epimerase